MECIELSGYMGENPTRTRSTLWSTLFVNKAWAAEAIRILWRNPPVSALAAIKDRDRRQSYAYHVRKLEVNSKRVDENSNLHGVEFP